MGLTIYVWNGSQAGRLEKIKGLDVARRIRDEERGGKAKIEVMGECRNGMELNSGWGRKGRNMRSRLLLFYSRSFASKVRKMAVGEKTVSVSAA